MKDEMGLNVMTPGMIGKQIEEITVNDMRCSNFFCSVSVRSMLCSFCSKLCILISSLSPSKLVFVLSPCLPSPSRLNMQSSSQCFWQNIADNKLSLHLNDLWFAALLQSPQSVLQVAHSPHQQPLS